MPRLTLDTTGIKSPLDIVPDEPRTEEAATIKTRTRTTKPQAPHRARPRRQNAAPQSPPSSTTTRPTFYGVGRPVQTSIAVDLELSERLEELARAGAVSVNALLVATLHAGLPTTVDDARQAAVLERADQPAKPRAERNIRLPAQLRARLDELTSGVQNVARRANRADIVNATLRSTTPHTAEDAAQLVSAYRRLVELEPLASASTSSG